MKHDIIVIGGSAGSVAVLIDALSELPADLPASVFATVHLLPGYSSSLPKILSERGRLPASHPVHAEKILPGHIYLAPSDNHLLVRQGFMEVVRGPRENGHRPAVDALFRTAAAAYGPRVIGVVLSGYLDCGTAGSLSIKARGGLVVVQDPQSALAPDMPRSAISRVDVDHVVGPAELPSLLAQLAATPAGPETPPDNFVSQLEGEARGGPAELACPLCQGALTEVHSKTFKQFRCHVGHTFSAASLVREQDEELERALWAAVRALEESASISRQLGASERGELGRRFAEKATTLSEHAELIRQVLLHGSAFSRPEAAHDAPGA